MSASTLLNRTLFPASNSAMAAQVSALGARTSTDRSIVMAWPKGSFVVPATVEQAKYGDLPGDIVHSEGDRRSALIVRDPKVGVSSPRPTPRRQSCSARPCWVLPERRCRGIGLPVGRRRRVRKQPSKRSRVGGTLRVCRGKPGLDPRDVHHPGRLGLERIVSSGDVAMQPRLDSPIACPEGTQAVAEHFPLRGILSGGDFGPDGIGHLVGQRDANCCAERMATWVHVSRITSCTDPSEPRLTQPFAVGEVGHCLLKCCGRSATSMPGFGPVPGRRGWEGIAVGPARVSLSV